MFCCRPLSRFARGPGSAVRGVVAAVESATVYRFDRPEAVAKPTVADDAYPVESADLPLTKK